MKNIRPCLVIIESERSLLLLQDPGHDDYTHLRIPAMVIVRMTESPCPTLMGKTSRSPSRQLGEAFLCDLIGSLLEIVDAGPQHAVWSHTFAEERKNRRK